MMTQGAYHDCYQTIYSRTINCLRAVTFAAGPTTLAASSWTQYNTSRMTFGSSVLYVSTSSGTLGAGEGVAVCERLLGKQCNGIAGGAAGLIALCDEGCFDVESGQCYVNDLQCHAGSVGSSAFTLIATATNELYSWGKGELGELGLGAGKKVVPTPLRIDYSADFSQLSSGSNHSMAVDSTGCIYAWGQNFDNQLCLYNKTAAQMRENPTKQNVIIEPVLYTPRKLPICIRQSIRKVSCGDNFTLILTRKGEVFSWGGGESGQLGTGRCTSRNLPRKVVVLVPNPALAIAKAPSPGKPSAKKGKKPSAPAIDPEVEMTFTDIAAGAAHSLAISADGSVYSWGMNKRGQLGLYEDASTADAGMPTMQKPTKIPSLPHPNPTRVIAHGNSSALLGDKGELFVWGSGSYCRLMQGHDRHLLFPTPVSSMAKAPVADFAFSKHASCALVRTELTAIYPSEVPQASCGKLSFEGVGFWPSDSIIVTFTNITNPAAVLPRSTVGQFSKDSADAAGVNTLRCKPPKLAEAGEYEVSLSMTGGKTILDRRFILRVYKEFNIIEVKPGLIDLGMSEESFQLSLKVRGLAHDINTDEMYAVKLNVIISTPDGQQKTMVVTCSGKICMDESSVADIEAMSQSIAAEAARDSNIESRPSTAISTNLGESSFEDNNSITRTPSQAMLEAIKVIYNVSCDVDMKKIKVKGTENALIAIRAQLSLNGCDYCELSAETDTVICHAFRAVSLSPSCCEYRSKAAGNVITVRGESFIPSRMLPEGTYIEAVVRAFDDKNNLREIIVPIHCDTADELTFKAPSIVQLMNGKLVVDPKKKKPTSAASAAVSASSSRPSTNKTASKRDLSFPAKPILAATVFFQMSTQPQPELFEGSLASLDSRSVTSTDSKKNPPIQENAAPKLLGSSQLKFTYFENKGLELATAVTRIDGKQVIGVSGADGGFLVSPKDAVVRISRPDYNFYHDINDLAVVEITQPTQPAGKSAKAASVAPDSKYSFSFMLPSLKARLVAEEGGEGEEEVEPAAAVEEAVDTSLADQVEQLSLQEQPAPVVEEAIENLPTDPLTHVYVSVFMDGVPAAVEDDSKLAKLSLFDAVSIVSVNTPKGGFPAGAPVSLTVEGLHADLAAVMQTCVVRVRGLGADGDVVTCEGRVDFESNIVEFTMPDIAAEVAAGTAIEAEIRGKDKFYFVDLSLDNGRSFDTHDEALLQAK